MAGIGFKLQRLFQEDYFSSRFKAYAFAGLVTAGPWLIVIITISLIQWLTSYLVDISKDQQELFTLSVSYCFIFSQVIFGIQQLVVTRYVADLIYEKRAKEIFSTFIGMSKGTLLFATILGGVFFFLSNLPFYFNVLIFILFVTINMIWVMFLFLSAAKNYQAVAYSFVTGALISLGIVLYLGFHVERINFSPYSSSFFLLAGFTAGMIVTLFGLLFAMLLTFGSRPRENQFGYLSYFDKFPSLFWTGFLYNSGIWVCNWVIWFGEGRMTLLDTFVYHRLYDTAIFWSYLTIIPTMIIFVVSVETRFYERYRIFYGNVNEGGTLAAIKKSKERMQRVLKEEVKRLFRSQGAISLLIIFSVGYITTIFGVEDRLITIFRFTIVGAFSNAMVLVITLILLYFEDRRGAMYTSIAFFALNLMLSLLFLPLGHEGYGLSFSIGSTFAFLFALLRLIVFIDKVDYHAFCRPHDLVQKETSIFSKAGRWLNQHTFL
ncbi:putative membrane protein [Alkalibacillus flavidus]|uniref:Membrane protein n=1 Tax=Alkalibacillus flavidus TaxID=546021 RepID=A0ABV2KTJ4_9BACI